MKIVVTLILMICGCIKAISAGIGMDAFAPNGNASALVDGSDKDTNAWTGTGVPLELELKLKAAVPVALIRIHPGIRGFASMPSTEASPKLIQTYADINGQRQEISAKTSIPRDPGIGAAFFIDIPLKHCVTDKVIIAVHETHDVGRRMTDPDKITVPTEKRNVSIREIEIFTVADLEEKDRESAALASVTAKLLAAYDQRIARNDNYGNALRQVFGRGIERLRTRDKNREQNQIKAETEHLQKTLLPYINMATEGTSKNATGPTLKIKSCSQSTPGTPAEFPINFSLIEKITGRKLSRNYVSLSAINSSGNQTNVCSNIEHQTPVHSMIRWTLLDDTDCYLIRFQAAGADEAMPLQKLLGNGDQLRFGKIVNSTLPYHIWSAKFSDIFPTGNKSLVCGYWTDYCHIFINSGQKDKPEFSEQNHFLIQDSSGCPIGTHQNPGLAFSIADPVDFDGDGKQDIFLSRYYYRTPLFVRNSSTEKDDFSFASPVSVDSLTKGFRYAYGDLTGDGIADAVGVRLANKNLEINFHRGLSLNGEGAPAFDKPWLIPLEIAGTPSPPGGASLPVVKLDDLNADGKLDLTVIAPPSVYVCFNDSTKDEVKFAEPRQIMTSKDTPFNIGIYYPNLSWNDMNGDGIPDLIQHPGFKYFTSIGTVLKVADQAVSPQCYKKQLRLCDIDDGLRSFAIVDLWGDHIQRFCQINNKMELQTAKYENGVFNDFTNIPLETPESQRFGCPDPGEYGALYSQLQMYDVDGDGKLDAVINSEHNWRFGYLSYYRNLGNGKFASEIKLFPKPDSSHMIMTSANNGKGQGFEINRRSIFDFFSFETKGLYSPDSGSIAFRFSPGDAYFNNKPKVFFSSGFIDLKRYPSYQERYAIYQNNQTATGVLKSGAGLALMQLPDGKIFCQSGVFSFETKESIKLEKGKTYDFVVKWNKHETTIELDGNLIAVGRFTPPSRIADLMHIGSMGWFGAQRDREYLDRITAHPVDFSFLACGTYYDFRITGCPSGSDFNFNDAIDKFALRSRIGYRCTPAFIHFNGRNAVIMPFDNHRRKERQDARTLLYLVPFKCDKDGSPVFDNPIPLKKTDNRPFFINTRTQIVATDWNDDGMPDLILTTENVANPYNIGIELYLNDGMWNFSKADDKLIKRLNHIITAHHDIKFSFASILDKTRRDIVVRTDPGLRLYSIPYLTRPEPEFQGLELIHDITDRDSQK